MKYLRNRPDPNPSKPNEPTDNAPKEKQNYQNKHKIKCNNLFCTIMFDNGNTCY